MKAFMDEDFLLNTEPARRLYNEYAKGRPIIDYHSHLPPKALAEDASYSGIVEVWLGGDHYKWRAMRANGIDERRITGEASPDEKFLAWAKTLPRLIGNPLYHWTQLELKRYFGIDELLTEKSAARIREACDAALSKPEFSSRGLVSKMNVKALCTTDDPVDDLAYHRAYASSRLPGSSVMVPTFRPDKAMATENAVAWNAWIARLETASGIKVTGWEGLAAALSARHLAFHEAGCRLSDHALERPIAEIAREDEIDALVTRLRGGATPSRLEGDKLKTAVLALVGRLDAERGWTMQLHVGAIRNLNSRMFAKLGPDTGYDAIGDGVAGQPLATFLDLLDKGGRLPKTILYTLNPTWNEILTTIAGCFQDGTVPGKLQFGPAWWFNDQIDGMTRQMTCLASMGLLSRFLGMLTDSRSFLSFPRHEYFRRLLCDLIGGWVAKGEAPADYDLLGAMVEDISWRNAARHFDIPGAGLD